MLDKMKIRFKMVVLIVGGIIAAFLVSLPTGCAVITRVIAFFTTSPVGADWEFRL